MLRIKELRKAKKMTAKELADFINVAESTMSLYENGKREPDFKTLLAIAERLEVSVDELFGKSNVSSLSVSEEPIPTQTEQESTLLKAFRETTEEGRMRIIQAVLNICDEIERKEIKTKSQNAAG